MAGLFLVVLGWLCGSQVASAHAELVATDPPAGTHFDQAPTEIVLTFSEPVGIVDGGTTLYPGDDTPIALEPQPNGATITIPLDAGLPDGTWTVQWRVISSDGHPIAGTLSFTVGDGATNGGVPVDQLPDWVGVARTVATAMKYIGLLTAAGGLIVGRLLAAADWRFVRNLTLILAAISLIGASTELPLLALEQRGSLTGTLANAVRSLDSSTLWAGILCLALLLAGMAGTRLRPSPSWVMSTSLLTAALFTQILSGHTRSREPLWLMLVSDVVHLLAGAVWLGGILVLALGLSGRWSGEAFSSTEDSARGVARFSTLAAFTALLVAGTGLAMAIIVVRSRDALLNTGYGITLLIKVGLVALVLVLAAVNRWSLVPRLSTGTTGALARLRQLVVVELVLLLAVGGVTARLVSQDPNTPVAPQESSANIVYEGEDALDDNHNVTVVVMSLGNREYGIHVSLEDTEGMHVVLTDGMEMAWTQPELGLGPISVNLGHDHIAQEYTGIVRLPAGGTWEVTIRADIDRFTDSRVTITVELPD